MIMTARTALEEISKDGVFQRNDAVWKNWISSERDAQFPPEKGRYHLYVRIAFHVSNCSIPFAHSPFFNL